MGSSQSSPPNSNPIRMLSPLLQNETIDWNEIEELLRLEPEQASLYCHFVDCSPLQVALSRNAPISVVRSLFHAYPDALYHVDGIGNSVAHTCVQASSVNCLEYILNNRNELAWLRNNKGKLPLHMNIKDADVAEALIRAYPDGIVQRDTRGRIPLHYAVQQEEPLLDVIRVLMQDTTIRKRDKGGLTPLQMWANKLEVILQTSEEQSSLPEELWVLFVDMIHIASPNQPLLHAILDWNSPLRLALYSLHQYPEDVTIRDSYGRTPLHIVAATIPPPLLVASSSSSSSLHHLLLLLDTLLQLHPSAARQTDQEGRLAIDIAAERGHSGDVLERLVQAEPRAVDTRDLRDKMYPFLAAALHANVSTTYHLLRAKPHVLSYLQWD